MIRVVTDPEILISALIGAREPAADLVLRALIDDRIAAIASPDLLDDSNVCCAGRSSPGTVMNTLSTSSLSASADTLSSSMTRLSAR